MSEDLRAELDRRLAKADGAQKDRAAALIRQAEAVLRRWKRRPDTANVASLQAFLAKADPASRA